MTTWDLARAHCLEHIETSTKLARLGEQLKSVHVESVIVIVSTISPSILVTPFRSQDRDSIKSTTDEISSVLSSDAPWRSYVTGDVFGLRLRHDGINIELTTQIEARVEVDLKL